MMRLMVVTLCWSALPLVACAQLEWTDASKLTVEGKGWDDTAAFYDRLPARAQKMVRPPVWRLSRDSAGICVRFVTDAPEVHVHWRLLKTQLALSHMPATGVSGVDLYLKTENGWRWAGAPRPNSQDMKSRLVSGLPKRRRSWRLYLPLYNGVKTVEIGVPKGHTVSPIRFGGTGRRKPIVFYGTSITQGACASRTGMCHPAILGRRLDRPVINLGFSGNGKMEPALATLLGELEPALYVLDCLPNMDGKMVAARVPPFVRSLRKARPRIPILLVEDRSYQNGHVSVGLTRRNDANRKALRGAFESLRASGLKRLHYLNGADLLGDDGEGTVDGSHPTDLGFMRQAAVMEPVIRRLLGR